MTACPVSIADVWEAEKPSLKPLPTPFDGYVEQSKRVSPTCLITFDRNRMMRSPFEKHAPFAMLRSVESPSRTGRPHDIRNQRAQTPVTPPCPSSLRLRSFVSAMILFA